MRIPNTVVALIATGALVIGCSGGGSEDDASAACDDLCDRYEDCGLDVTDGQICDAVCDEVDDLESDVSGDCEVAIADLFNCVEDQKCSELDDLDFEEIDDLFDLVDAVFADCEEEAEDVVDECEDDVM